MYNPFVSFDAIFHNKGERIVHFCPERTITYNPITCVSLWESQKEQDHQEDQEIGGG
jgi:hypothetical protein